MEITKATATSTLAAAIHNLSLSSLSSTIRPRPRPYSHSGFSKFPLVSRPTSLTATCSLPNETTTSSEWLNYVLFRVLWTGFWLFLLSFVVFCLPNYSHWVRLLCTATKVAGADTSLQVKVDFPLLFIYPFEYFTFALELKWLCF